MGLERQVRIMEKKKELTVYERQSKERINYLISEYCHGSQQLFAERTGLNKASVSQYVNGKNTPSNITASKIAEAFHVDPAWVMGFDVQVVKPSAGDTFDPDFIKRALFYYERIQNLSPAQQKSLEDYLSFLQSCSVPPD